MEETGTATWATLIYSIKGGKVSLCYLSSVVQWSGHRTLNPRTRVRFPVEEFFFSIPDLYSFKSLLIKSRQSCLDVLLDLYYENHFLNSVY